jgi:hypothetical protein
VVKEVKIEQFFSSKFLFFVLLITHLAVLHNHLSPPHEVCDSPDVAAHYHTVGHMLGVSSLTVHLAGLGVKIFSLLSLDKMMLQ